MRLSRALVVAFCAFVVLRCEVLAEGKGKPWNVRIGVLSTYDDNYTYEPDGVPRESAFGVRIEPDLLVNLVGERATLGLGVRPVVMGWTDRADKDTDYEGDAYLNLSYAISRRFSLQLNEALRRAEQPELIEDGNIVRWNGDYWHNKVSAGADLIFGSKVGMRIMGGYGFLRYDDESDWSEILDSDSASGRGELWVGVMPETVVFGELCYDDERYAEIVRDIASYRVGTGVRTQFTPSLLARLTLGYMLTLFPDAAIQGSEESPYVATSVNFGPSPRTRIDASASYQTTKTDVHPYVAQAHTTVGVRATHDITAKLSANISGTYDHGEYDRTHALDPSADWNVREDGEAADTGVWVVPGDLINGGEDMFTVGVGVNFNFSRNHSVEARYDYRIFETEIVNLRHDYDRGFARAGYRLSL